MVAGSPDALTVPTISEQWTRRFGWDGREPICAEDEPVTSTGPDTSVSSGCLDTPVGERGDSFVDVPSLEGRSKLFETRRLTRRRRPGRCVGAAAGKDLRTVYKETYARLKPRFGEWVIVRIPAQL